jgi:bifunctional UDP-N-acetylglucosamine pyrophosphorylase/glucosamine-1-phosphate N-acetyltransferase
MKALILDPGKLESCQPITCSRSLAEFPVANLPLAEHQLLRLRKVGFEVSESADSPGRALQLFLSGDSWISDKLLEELADISTPVAVTNHTGHALAWISSSQEPCGDAPALTADEFTFQILYPWDLLRLSEILVPDSIQESRALAKPDGVTVDGRLVVGSNTRFLPGVYIEGDVVIGDDCKIGPNCYIRGRTSIGNNCRVGQAVEIKNSVVLSNTAIGHLSYCGDSVVGEKVNFGAGTIIANFRHDGGNHRSMVGDQLLDTGRRKFGAIIGDGVHTAIHTSIYPGRKLWPGVSTLPGQVVKQDLVN